MPSASHTQAPSPRTRWSGSAYEVRSDGARTRARRAASDDVASGGAGSPAASRSAARTFARSSCDQRTSSSLTGASSAATYVAFSGWLVTRWAEMATLCARRVATTPSRTSSSAASSGTCATKAVTIRRAVASGSSAPSAPYATAIPRSWTRGAWTRSPKSMIPLTAPSRTRMLPAWKSPWMTWAGRRASPGTRAAKRLSVSVASARSAGSRISLAQGTRRPAARVSHRSERPASGWKKPARSRWIRASIAPTAVASSAVSGGSRGAPSRYVTTRTAWGMPSSSTVSTGPPSTLRTTRGTGRSGSTCARCSRAATWRPMTAAPSARFATFRTNRPRSVSIRTLRSRSPPRW